MLEHEISYLICHISLAFPTLGNPCRKLRLFLISTWALQSSWNIPTVLSSATATPACCLQKTLGAQIPKVLIYPAAKFTSREGEAWSKSLKKRNTGDDMYFMCPGRTWAHLHVVLRVQPKLAEHLTVNQRFSWRSSTKPSLSLRLFCFHALPEGQKVLRNQNDVTKERVWFFPPSEF